MNATYRSVYANGSTRVVSMGKMIPKEWHLVRIEYELVDGVLTLKVTNANP